MPVSWNAIACVLRLAADNMKLAILDTEAGRQHEALSTMVYFAFVAGIWQSILGRNNLTQLLLLLVDLTPV